MNVFAENPGQKLVNELAGPGCLMNIRIQKKGN